MNPTEFPGQNCVYAANQPEYRPLPAHRTVDGQVTSCWQLTWRERLRVMVTGRFYFTQLTFNSPLQPQLPTVDLPEHVSAASRSKRASIAG